MNKIKWLDMGKKYEPHERKNNIFTINLKEEGDG